MLKKPAPESIDQYIAPYPENIRQKLEQMRETIRRAAPDAEEYIGYGMPAFKQQGSLVYFAAFKNHVGFYPASSGVRAFEKELQGYETSKGAIRFPYDKTLPLELVAEITRFRVAENLEKAANKRKK